MTVRGSGVGAVVSGYQNETLRRQQELCEQIAQRKRETQKQVMHLRMQAMGDGTQAEEEASLAANGLLEALHASIRQTACAQCVEHTFDILEKNEKQAEKQREKKRKKDLQKQKRREHEALRKGKLVLKQVLILSDQTRHALEEEKPVVRTRNPIQTVEVQPEDGKTEIAERVWKYMMTTEYNVPAKIQNRIQKSTLP